MTPLSPARRDAEAFARAVDNHRAGVDARGDVADRYASLLTAVDVLRAQEIPAPRADFVADLRMRLMDAADTLLLPADAELAPVIPLAAPPSRRQRRVSIAAAALVVVGGSAGVAAAAENALPGDALYPLKRGIESAQVSLNSSDSGKGQDLLRQASTRLTEVDGLIADDESADRIVTTLSSFQRSAVDGADLLFVSYQRDGDPADITRLRAMIASQLSTLTALSSKAPSDAVPAFEAARDLLADLDQQARVLCATCGSGDSAEFTTAASSAQALDSLLTGPIVAAEQAAAEQAANDALAEQAEQEATKGDKQSDTPPKTDKPTPADNGKPIGPLPTPDPTATITGALGGLTSGVNVLLGEVEAATGGATKPLTDTLTSTLGMLGGQK